jgi:hypothetical protein
MSMTCFDTPFDTLAVQVGDTLEIVSGLNKGTWTILEIDRAKAVLNKTSGIQEGVSDTIVKFNLKNITKNRLSEGFTNITGIKGGGSSNMRHNPKYHMARWFPFYGGNLNKKLDTESLIVSNYKNNGNVTMSWTSTELSNELNGLTKLDANEPLGRFRSYRNTFFTGETIKVTLENVSFSEFLKCYENWRYGHDKDKTKSRGFISLNINGKTIDVYLFGDNAMTFSKGKNELTIEGKVKNKQYDHPRFKIFDYTFDYTFE